MRKIFYYLLFVAIIILVGAGWYYYSAVLEAQKGVVIKVEKDDVSKPENDFDLAKEDDLTSVTGQGEVVSIDEKNIVIKDTDGRSQSWEIAERLVVQTLNMDNLIYEDSLLTDIKVGSGVFLSGLGREEKRFAHLIQAEPYKKYEGRLESDNGSVMVLKLVDNARQNIVYNGKTIIREMLTKQEIVDVSSFVAGDFIIAYCEKKANDCLANVIVVRKGGSGNGGQSTIPVN